MNLALLVSVKPSTSFRSQFKRVPPGVWKVKFLGPYLSVIGIEELGSPLAGKMTDGMQIVGGKSISLSFLTVNPQDKDITISLEKINGLVAPEHEGRTA